MCIRDRRLGLGEFDINTSFGLFGPAKLPAEVTQRLNKAFVDALKTALENLERPYAGVVTTHDRPFSPTDHDAFTRNMVWLGTWRRGEVHFQYPEDAKRASMIRRKEQG